MLQLVLVELLLMVFALGLYVCMMSSSFCSLQGVQTRDDMWNWLNYTLPGVFWSVVDADESLPTLASYNES